MDPETRQYPMPGPGVCPPYFVRSRVGVALLSRRACNPGPDCEVLNIHATEKADAPSCPHSCFNEAGVFNVVFCRDTCEVIPACQYAAFGHSDDPPGMWIAHPSWGNRWERLDKRSSDQCAGDGDCRLTHVGHHRSENESGVLKALACPAGVGAPPTSNNPIPPGCSVAEIQLQ